VTEEVSGNTPKRESLIPATTLDMTPLKRNEADVTTVVAPSAPVLSAEDRCDRCGAQAYLRVELHTGGELLFCAHHAREHEDKLRQVAVNFVDETHRLAGTQGAASL